MFLTVSLPLYVKRANCSCRASLFFKDRRDRFAFVALYKRVTVSELISSVFKQERWERLTFFSQLNRSFALLITKTSDSLENPMPEFPTLPRWRPGVCVSPCLERVGRLQNSNELPFDGSTVAVAAFLPACSQ